MDHVMHCLPEYGRYASRDPERGSISAQIHHEDRSVVQTVLSVENTLCEALDLMLRLFGERLAFIGRTDSNQPYERDRLAEYCQRSLGWT